MQLMPVHEENQFTKHQTALVSPTREQVIEIPAGVRVKAKAALDKMFELSAVPAALPASVALS